MALTKIQLSHVGGMNLSSGSGGSCPIGVEDGVGFIMGTIIKFRDIASLDISSEEGVTS